jgi:hypothetical protein
VFGGIDNDKKDNKTTGLVSLVIEKNELLEEEDLISKHTK